MKIIIYRINPKKCTVCGYHLDNNDKCFNCLI